MHVWMPHLPTDRHELMHGSGEISARPLVLSAMTRGSLIVEAVDERAREEGLSVGMTLSEARALVPQIRVEQAAPHEDDRALRTIARKMERFTPLVGLDPPDGLFLDISGCAHLFGGENAMKEDVLARLHTLGFCARAAVADTPALSWAMAHYGPGTITVPGAGVEAIAELPVEALRLPEEITNVLTRLGLKTVGSLFRQPRAPLIHRFGSELARRMDQIRAHQDEPINPVSPLEPFVAERRFAEPLVQIDAVEGCLSGLCRSLCETLKRRGEGARSIRVRLFHSNGAEREASAGTSEPLADPTRIGALLMPQVQSLSQRIEDESGIDLIRLSVNRTGPLEPYESDLYDAASSATGLAELVDTLSERLGRSNVQRLHPSDTHQPGKADIRLPALHSKAQNWPEIAHQTSRFDGPLTPSRPVRLFNPPEPIEAVASVPDGPPVRFVWRKAFFHVVAAEGPERIGPEWWEFHEDEAPTCDYFAVEDSEGRRFWVFRSGLYGEQPHQPRWFIQGLFG